MFKLAWADDGKACINSQSYATVAFFRGYYRSMKVTDCSELWQYSIS